MYARWIASGVPFGISFIIGEKMSVTPPSASISRADIFANTAVPKVFKLSVKDDDDSVLSDILWSIPDINLAGKITTSVGGVANDTLTIDNSQVFWELLKKDFIIYVEAEVDGVPYNGQIAVTVGN